MHSVIQPDGSHRQSKYLRVGSSIAYFLFTVGGILLILSPELTAVYSDSGVWMTWFLIVGGMLSLTGASSGYWVGEFIGAPLLAFAFAILGIETLMLNYARYPLLSGADFCFLLALSALITLRWWRVCHIYQFVHEAALMERRMKQQSVGDDYE